MFASRNTVTYKLLGCRTKRSFAPDNSIPTKISNGFFPSTTPVLITAPGPCNFSIKEELITRDRKRFPTVHERIHRPPSKIFPRGFFVDVNWITHEITRQPDTIFRGKTTRTEREKTFADEIYS